MGGEKLLVAVATACPWEESDLRQADAEAIAARLSAPASESAPGRQVALHGLPGSPSLEEELELWPWLLVGGIAVVLVELLVLKLFRI